MSSHVFKKVPTSRSTDEEVAINSVAGSCFGDTYYILTPNLSPDKEVVVLIHGIGSYSFQFELMSHYLETQGYCVLRYDLLGRGYSKFPTSGTDDGSSIFGASGHVSQLRDLLIHLGITNRHYNIIAHSMGGALAALYIEQYPSEVSALVLLSPAGLMDCGIFKFLKCCKCLHGLVKTSLRRTQEKAWRQDFYEHAGDSLQLENDFVAKLQTRSREQPTVFDAFWESVLHFPLYGLEPVVASLTARHDMRVLLAWAAADTSVPYQPCFFRWRDPFLTARHPHFQCHVYEGAAHGFFVEKSDRVHADILKFLRTV